MTVRVAVATAQRVLWQMRHDPRMFALLLVVPCLLLVLLRYVFDGGKVRWSYFALHVREPPAR
jgi:ABC-2 type transport system permease protein